MRWAVVPFVAGISLCLIGAFSMAWGEGLLGENHTGIAAVIGIIGMGFLGTSATIHAGQQHSQTKEKRRL